MAMKNLAVMRRVEPRAAIRVAGALAWLGVETRTLRIGLSDATRSVLTAKFIVLTGSRRSDGLLQASERVDRE
jgi:hypothetical protein